jgi:hypothetical protein
MEWTFKYSRSSSTMVTQDRDVQNRNFYKIAKHPLAKKTMAFSNTMVLSQNSKKILAFKHHSKVISSSLPIISHITFSISNFTL